jgi:hypothetical protein
MYYTKNNYLRTYNTGNLFYSEIDSPVIKNSNYHDLTIKVAEEVQASRQGKLYLMYSGGVDSEYILSIFLSLKISL